jgi:transposase-like protein
VEIHILGPSERRRMWSAQEKAALLAEIDAEGGKVRLVARRHQISESVLYNWRSARKAAAVAMGAPEDVEFIPVGVVDDRAATRPALLAAPDPEPVPQPPSADGNAGSIEIVLPNGTRLSVDAFVNEKALSRVLRAVRGVA